MARSGVSSCLRPSIWDWKVTPISVIFLSFASDMTWKPPESVRIGSFPADEVVQAAECGDASAPGRSMR